MVLINCGKQELFILLIVLFTYLLIKLVIGRIFSKLRTLLLPVLSVLEISYQISFITQLI